MKTLRVLHLLVVVVGLLLISGMAYAIGQGVNTAISPVGSYGQVVVDNTATLIAPAGGRVSITLRNTGTVNVYIGFDANVGADNGFLLQASSKEAITLDRTTSAIYAIVAADNTTVSYLKE